MGPKRKLQFVDIGGGLKAAVSLKKQGKKWKPTLHLDNGVREVVAGPEESRGDSTLTSWFPVKSRGCEETREEREECQDVVPVEKGLEAVEVRAGPAAGGAPPPAFADQCALCRFAHSAAADDRAERLADLADDLPRFRVREVHLADEARVAVIPGKRLLRWGTRVEPSGGVCGRPRPSVCPILTD